MIRFFLRTLCGLFLFSLVVRAGFSQGKTSPHPTVVIVTIDGFPARALQDPHLPMPTLRSMIHNGAVADAMRPINPTVTWPNHTAMVTGVDASHHFVMANGLLTFPADGTGPEVMPWTPKDELVHARTLYEAATEKGLTTAQVDWVAISKARGVTWKFGEAPELDDTVTQELIADHTISADDIRHFGKGSPAWHDEVWTDAAVDIIEKHRPNLLLLHLLQTDSLQHEYGPLTAAAYSAYANADACLGRVVDAVRKAGLSDSTTFFVLSDHGFSSFTHTIRPNVELTHLGLLQEDHGQVKGKVWVKAEGGGAELFILDRNERASLVPKLKQAFEGIEGVAHVYTNSEAQTLGLPSDEKTDQAPQLFLAAAPGYAFDDAATGDVLTTHEVKGQHGYLNSNPEMSALFVASGAAIHPGVHLGTISNLQVAPTIAQILGLEMPDAKQAPLPVLRQEVGNRK